MCVPPFICRNKKKIERERCAAGLVGLFVMLFGLFCSGRVGRCANYNQGLKERTTHKQDTGLQQYTVLTKQGTGPFGQQ